MIRKKVSLIFFFTLLLANFAFAEKIADLEATDYVNDFAGVLTKDQVLELSQQLFSLEKANGNQVAVVIVKNLDGDYIEHYATKLYEKWGMGTKELDEGVLFLVSIEDRTMRIEVGYGLEPVLTDGISKDILDNTVRPEFKNGDYYQGIKKGVENISTVLNGGTLPVKASDTSMGGSDWFTIAIVLFILFINLFAWFFAIIARSKSWWLGGVVCFVIGFPILFFLGFTILNNALLFIFTLTGFIFDYFVSKNYKYWQEKLKAGSAGHPAWWAGGTWGPGSGGFKSGGSGFGGFGGGGFSGGGGASSSW
jgi:uncharacterized protein